MKLIVLSFLFVFFAANAANTSSSNLSRICSQSFSLTHTKPLPGTFNVHKKVQHLLPILVQETDFEVPVGEGFEVVSLSYGIYVDSKTQKASTLVSINTYGNNADFLTTYIVQNTANLVKNKTNEYQFNFKLSDVKHQLFDGSYLNFDLVVNETLSLQKPKPNQKFLVSKKIVPGGALFSPFRKTKNESGIYLRNCVGNECTLPFDINANEISVAHDSFIQKTKYTKIQKLSDKIAELNADSAEFAFYKSWLQRLLKKDGTVLVDANLFDDITNQKIAIKTTKLYNRQNTPD